MTLYGPPAEKASVNALEFERLRVVDIIIRRRELGDIAFQADMASLMASANRYTILALRDFVQDTVRNLERVLREEGLGETTVEDPFGSGSVGEFLSDMDELLLEMDDEIASTDMGE